MALTVKIRGDATQFEKTMAKVKGTVNGFGSGMAKMTGQALAFSAALAGIGGGLAVASKFIETLKDSSGKAATMESLTTQFGVLLQDGGKALDLIKTFRQEATKSPLTTADYANAGKTLLAFGTANEKVLPVLRMLGDVSMGNSERFSALALAFAQTQAAGRLMGQEVLQFVNAGFNPLQQISKKTGVSMAELKKRMEEGAISADMVTQAFKDATSKGGLFFGAIDKGAATFEGKLAKLTDTVDGLKISFGTGLNEGLKVAFDSANELLPAFEQRVGEFGRNVGLAIAQAAEGNPEIFVKTGVLMGEYLVAGIKTSIDRMWMNMGTKWLSYANLGGGATPVGWKNEDVMSTFDRYSEGVRAAQESLRQSLPGGEQFQERNLAEERRRTDMLLDEVKKGTKTMEQVLEELRKDKPFTKR